MEPNGHVPNDDWGTPLAPDTPPDTAGPLGSEAVTVEIATLFDPDEVTHMPAQQGDLMTVTCDQACELTFTANTTRAPASPSEVGGAVLLDGSSANLVQEGTCAVTTECYVIGNPRHIELPAQYVLDTPGQPNYTAWQTIAPQYRDIWCSPNQPLGDANNDGYANPEDYVEIFAHNGESSAVSPYTDVNHDGFTNPQDYIQVFDYQLKGTGTPCPIAFP
jgi:hypothetical protein